MAEHLPREETIRSSIKRTKARIAAMEVLRERQIDIRREYELLDQMLKLYKLNYGDFRYEN